MFLAIKDFFEKNISPNNIIDEGDFDRRLKLATAALLVEVMRADHDVKQEEREVVIKAIQAKFDLNKTETADLVALAEREAENSVSYYEFTSLINKGFNAEQKIKVVELLWQVVFADNVMDKYEEATVRKISDLLYVPHKDFIATRHRVQNMQT